MSPTPSIIRITMTKLIIKPAKINNSVLTIIHPISILFSILSNYFTLSYIAKIIAKKY